METTASSSKASPLLGAQRALGAQFAEAFGWMMARDFGDPRAEAQAVRQRAGLSDLSYYGVLKVSGGEAVQFLNGLVSNDVKTLAEQQGVRAAFLTGHGKVRGLCRILRRQEDFLIINDPQTHEKILKYIFPFSYAGDFRVEDVSEQFRSLSLQGPKATAVLKEISFEPIPALAEYAWAETMIGGHHSLVLRTSHTGETGFDILVPDSGVQDLWDFMLLKGAFHGLVPVGLDALNLLRIEAGIPIYGIDVDEANMLLELGLADAVSFTKGCYTGQEAVAMATYRGHISKKLSGLLLEGERIPVVGSKVSKDGKDVGHVTSATRSVSQGQVIALAYIKYGFFDAGNEVEVADDAGAMSGRVTELPFYQNLGG
ncbi:MAG TPA: aminomethyltransferase family protein [Blastocatellia bacterium]|nr:aminomethyltransferase family protein [Blastocatellia bacterium]